MLLSLCVFFNICMTDGMPWVIPQACSGCFSLDSACTRLIDSSCINRDSVHTVPCPWRQNKCLNEWQRLAGQSYLSDVVLLPRHNGSAVLENRMPEMDGKIQIKSYYKKKKKNTLNGQYIKHEIIHKKRIYTNNNKKN